MEIKHSCDTLDIQEIDNREGGERGEIDARGLPPLKNRFSSSGWPGGMGGAFSSHLRKVLFRERIRRIIHREKRSRRGRSR